LRYAQYSGVSSAPRGPTIAARENTEGLSGAPGKAVLAPAVEVEAGVDADVREKLPIVARD